MLEVHNRTNEPEFDNEVYIPLFILYNIDRRYKQEKIYTSQEKMINNSLHSF